MKVAGRNFPPPASIEVVASLRNALPSEVPDDYFAFMKRSDGAQIWFDATPAADFDCVRIYSASLLLSLRASHRELLPSLVVIGGDQGAQYLGYDTSAGSPWPIVMHLPGSGSTKIAMSFAELEGRYFRPIGEEVLSAKRNED